MDCNECRERLAAAFEDMATDDGAAATLAHLSACAPCRAELDQVAAVRQRLVAAGAAVPEVSLVEGLMGRIRSVERAGAAGSRSRPDGGRRWPHLIRAALSWRLATAATVAAVALVFAAVMLRAPSYAWNISQSIEATRGLDAIHIRGSFGGGPPMELWARAAPDHRDMERLLIRVANGPVIWTKANSTYYLDPTARVVYTDDARTAGFSTWPGPELFELAQAAGIRETGRHRSTLTGHQHVAVEFSLSGVGAQGPTVWEVEFDTQTKLLRSLRQWTNLERRGPPAFEAHTVSYFPSLPDDTFAVSLPSGVRYQQKEITVADEALGLLAMPGYGIEVPGVSIEDAARQLMTEMWRAIMRSDLDRFRQLCPVAAGWNSALLAAAVGPLDEAHAVVEVLEVGPGVPRGHSRLGPVTVVTSRVRRRDGHAYEDKIIVQHLLTGPTPRCVIYSGYGVASYRLEQAER